jgi:hypothetical protein
MPLGLLGGFAAGRLVNMLDAVLPPALRFKPPLIMSSTPAQPYLPPDSSPFDERFRALAVSFSAEALTTVPELTAVLVVPVWHQPLLDIYPGVITSRRPTPATFAELHHTIQQCLRVIEERNARLQEHLQTVDNYAHELATTITALQEQDATTSQHADSNGPGANPGSPAGPAS